MTKDITNDRLTASEYKEKYNDLLNKVEKLKQIIVTRLYTLCCSYPEVPVTSIKDENGVSLVEIKAKSLIPINRDKGYIKSLSVEKILEHISTIEKYNAKQHPHKQTVINFGDKPIGHNYSSLTEEEQND